VTNKCLILSVMVVFSLLGSTATAADFPIIERESTGGVVVSVNPNVELVLGLFAYVDQPATPNGPEPPGYTGELLELLGPFSEHPAFQQVRELADQGFTGAGPVGLASRLSHSPDRSLRYPYGWLVDEWPYAELEVGPKHLSTRGALEQLRISLADLNRKVDFDGFYIRHRALYSALVDGVVREVDLDNSRNWVEDFYGHPLHSYRVIVSPGPLPYSLASWAQDYTGGRIGFAVIQLDETPTRDHSRRLTGALVHEWGHTYVHPLLDEHLSTVETLRPLVDRMGSTARAYGFDRYPSTFFEEQIIRAATALALEDAFGQEALKEEIRTLQDNGFYLTPFTIDQLRHYRDHRDKFPDFAGFLPYLLKQYQQRLCRYQAVHMGCYLLTAVLVLGIAFIWWRLTLRGVSR